MSDQLELVGVKETEAAAAKKAEVETVPAKDTKQTKKTTKKSGKKAEQKDEPVKKYKAPFGFAFGPNVMDTIPGLIIGKEYTVEEVINVLKPMVTELHAPGVSLYYHEPENVFVLTNILQKKGAVAQMSSHHLAHIQNIFLNTFLREKTEDRVLVYFDKENTALHIVHPDAEKTAVSVNCDAPMYWNNNLNVYLIADLHSHHHMGAYFSPTDDANEKVRGIIYGVCSWSKRLPYIFEWRFREYDGNQFINLQWEDVIADVESGQ